MDIVLLFPGQGAQKPGMGCDLAGTFAEARDVFDAADAALGFPLASLCFEGPEAELTRTENAQPALLTHGAAAWAVVRDAVAPHVRAAAGHSLGEFTAHHASGAFAFDDAVRLVRRRGELMAECGAAIPGTMAAILGLADAVVEDICRRASAEGIVVPANYNAPEQVVISGEIPAVERASALARADGARRALRLAVAGAFHSPLMASARDGLGAALGAVPTAPAAFPVYADVTAAPTPPDGGPARLLLEQLTAPVRWTSLIAAIVARWPSALFVELGPGTVLAGLVRRIAPGHEVVPCGTAAEAANLLSRVAG